MTGRIFNTKYLHGTTITRTFTYNKIRNLAIVLRLIAQEK
jgi:hypothetical protein